MRGRHGSQQLLCSSAALLAACVPHSSIRNHATHSASDGIHILLHIISTSLLRTLPLLLLVQVVYPWDALDIWEHTQLAEAKAENRSPLAELNQQAC
jgi:hypothetical protein